ncbi:unnamed protein product [Agarophyton chilense]
MEQLPRDALLTILSYLGATDIARLRCALPPWSPLRAITNDPFVWRFLFFRNFPELRSVPHLTITASGTLDWRAAFRNAERRRALINRRRANGWRYALNAPPAPSHPRNPPAIRIVLHGNIHRIVSDTAERSAANVTWDSHIRAARFDWSGTQPPLSTPHTSPPHSRSLPLSPLPPSPPSSPPPHHPP